MKIRLAEALALSVLLAVSCTGCGDAELPPLPRSKGETAIFYARKTACIVPRWSGGAGAEKTARMIADSASRYPGFRIFTDEFKDQTPNGKMTFRNVIAELPGNGRDFLVIGAHYDSKKLDSVPSFSGANDGGSGVGALFAMMESLSSLKKPLPLTLRFVFFDGEEALMNYSETDGLHGSRRYVRKLKEDDELSRCKAMLLLDMVGDRDLKLTLPADTPSGLRNIILNSAKELGLSALVVADGPVMLDDHTPFAKAGIPAADLIDFEYGPDNLYWHTREDTVDKLSGESLENVSLIALKTIWNIMKRKGTLP